jgi:hypothetical protein
MSLNEDLARDLGPASLADAEKQQRADHDGDAREQAGLICSQRSHQLELLNS